MKQAKIEFPQTLYVKHEPDYEAGYFVPTEDINGHAEIGEKVRVGVYQLVETVVVETVIERRTVRS
jgi:hypothetical protein